MFPYFELPAIELGPVTLHAFGILVASAILLGRWMLVRRAERRGLDGETASRLVLWMVACGLLGAHLVAVTLSDPRDIFQDPPGPDSTVGRDCPRWVGLQEGFLPDCG